MNTTQKKSAKINELDEPDCITEEVSGYYPSFFTYWKKVQKQLSKYTSL